MKVIRTNSQNKSCRLLIANSLFHGSLPKFSLSASVSKFLFNQPTQVRSDRRLIETLDDFV